MQREVAAALSLKKKQGSNEDKPLMRRSENKFSLRPNVIKFNRATSLAAKSVVVDEDKGAELDVKKSDLRGRVSTQVDDG